MNNNYAILLLLISAFLTMFSQILLKKAATRSVTNVILKFVNPFVLVAYFIFLIIILINMFAMKYLNYNVVILVNNTLPFILSLFYTKFFLKYNISKRNIIAAIFIIVGIIIVLK